MCSAVQCCCQPKKETRGNENECHFFFSPIFSASARVEMVVCVFASASSVVVTVPRLMFLCGFHVVVRQQTEESERYSEELRDALGSPMIAASKMKDPGGEECTKKFRFYSIRCFSTNLFLINIKDYREKKNFPTLAFSTKTTILV